MITPTVAFGKGWGPFDIQTTAGIGLPTGDSQKLGQPVTWNLRRNIACCARYGLSWK